MDEFKAKRPVDVGIYLKENGLSADICEIFEENEIGGEEFLELTEDNIIFLVKKMGIAKKIGRLITEITSAHQSFPDRSLSSPFGSPVPLSPMSPFSSSFSPQPPTTPSESGDDSMSVVSSASSLALSKKFKIPDTWRPVIMSCINAKDNEEKRRRLTPEVRNYIVRDLVTTMFSYNLKPSKDFCTHVAKSLVQKYKFMKDVGANVSGYGSWEKKIIERVSNASRKRSADQETPSPKAKRGRPKLTVLSRYPPLRGTGGIDNIEEERNVAALQKEMDRENPRKDIILPLLKETFASRRQHILGDSDDLSATTILETYKPLSLPFVLDQEMDLILDQKDIVKTTVNSWRAKWAPAVLCYAEGLTSKSAKTILKEAQTMFEGDVDQDEKVAVYVLTKFVGKKDSLPYIYEECKVTDDPSEVAKRAPPRNSPRFAGFKNAGGESSYIIFVEQKVLCRISSFSKALVLWFSIHYIFNLEYCKQTKDVALFFQEYVFGLPDRSKKSATYLTVCSDIQSYAS